MADDLGYNQDLFILAFDHRASFAKNVFGLSEPPNELEKQQIHHYKQIIYKGFQQAILKGIPERGAAILIDEETGDAVLQEAITEKHIVILTIEKSGQEEFDFQYGDNFGAHIEKYKPTFAKALIRYNPEGDTALNKRQRQRLKILNDYCHSHGYKFLIEPLIPATAEQLASVGGEQHRYDVEIRPALTSKMITELNSDSIEPDIWKIEGMEHSQTYEDAVKHARMEGRDKVGVVILGRDAPEEVVEEWLEAGAKVPGVVGFAIGRTIFQQTLVNLHSGKIDDTKAMEEIAENYLHYYKVFTAVKKHV